ncbi:MAG: polysaccharide deacetylase family protein [Tissierellia bacterium]|nr:polysaccharide deacetylase family protein [Tissierellia bacterium]
MMKKAIWGILILSVVLLTGCKVIKNYSQGTYEDTYGASKNLAKTKESLPEEEEPEENLGETSSETEGTSSNETESKPKEDPSTHGENQKDSKKTEEIEDQEEGKKEATEPKDKIEEDPQEEESTSQSSEEEEDTPTDGKESQKDLDTQKEEKEKPSEEKPQDKKVAPRTERKDHITYEGKSNESLSWWYRPAKETGKGIPATINDDIAAMLDAVGGLWQVPNGQKKIYLTFDEGYEYKENTNAILDILKEKSVNACFFITGHFIQSRPDLVKRMVAEGHVVANHTIHHYAQPDALTKGLLIEDITGLEKMFTDLTGETMAPFMRPPAGAYSEATLSVVKDLGYRAVFWSFAYRDWLTDDQPDPEWALQKVVGQLHDGSIILLHAVSETNVAILGRFIDEAINQGYSFASMRELQ